MQKNVSGQKIGAQMVSATDGSAFTGAVTVYVTGDAGTQGAGSVGAGACTHEGNGYHTYAPAQAETNYDLIAFTFVGTGAVPATVQVFTRHDANVTHLLGTAWLTPATAGTPDVNAKLLGGTAQTGRDIGASVLLSSGTGTGQIKLASGYVAMTWADIAAPTTTVNLSGTTIATTQQVDVNTIKTQTITCAAGITVGAFVGQATAAIGVNASGHVSRVVLTDTVTTYTGDTPQTGDSYAIVNSGVHGNAAIKGYVDDIGTAGAGLTAIPWNAAWDAEVQSEVQDAIEANHLDHLIAVADPGSIVANSSLWAALTSKSATPAYSSYVNTTDSLEAIRDRGDAAWTPATAAVIADAVWDELNSGHLISGSFGYEIYYLLQSSAINLGNSVNDAAATTTAFNTTLTEADDFWNDALLIFTSGALAGQARPITDYANTNGRITFDEALTSAPANGSAFIIQPTHIHPVSQIADAVWDEATSGHTTSGTFGEQLKTDVDTILADTTQIKADLPARITKNVALAAFPFFMVDATDGYTAETGLTITATRSIDGAAFAACANSASEIASGWYKIDLAAADLNGNTIILRFTGTGARDRFITIVTQVT